MPGELPIRPIGGVEPRCFRICGDCAGLAVTSTSTSEARGWSEEGAPMIRGADAGASATHTGEGACCKGARNSNADWPNLSTKHLPTNKSCLRPRTLLQTRMRRLGIPHQV